MQKRRRAVAKWGLREEDTDARWHNIVAWHIYALAANRPVAPVPDRRARSGGAGT